MTATRFRSLLVGVALGSGALPGSARTQAQPTVVVVLPFENAGSYGKDRESFDALRKGLAALVASGLAGHAGIRVLPREEVIRLLTEQRLDAVERLDRETITRLGKLAGAAYAVSGSFIDLYGDFRIDARLLNLQSGEIVRVVRSDPALHDRQDMYRMIQSVIERLGGDPLPPGAGPPARQIPTEAIGLFSLGLLYLDRGDRAKAAELFQRALVLAPDFVEARQRVENRE